MSSDSEMDDNDIGGGLRYSKNCVSVGNSEATANWLLVAHYANWLPTEVRSGQVVLWGGRLCSCIQRTARFRLRFHLVAS